MIINLAFDVFAAILLLSAGMVVSSRNPVHSVLFLILAFINAAILFLIAGAEFLAMVLVIVYVGAVAVLFLFVVMMLDVDFAALAEGVQRYAPIGALVGLVLLIELGMVAVGWTIAPGAAAARLAPMAGGLTDTQALGALIYTRYLVLFQLSGVVLLVAMIGAILLTHRERKRAKTQNLDAQHRRMPADTLRLVTAELGQGVSLPSPAPTPAKEEV
ncbi:MAG: NADH-quinone oxidoreductase subunit J [Acidocella sp.]|nr:NADH-quinone oxidoreductase subunit J [Acidocella sp.]